MCNIIMIIWYHIEGHEMLIIVLMLNNLVILSEKLGIWDLRGQKIWDLGFEGSKI